MLYAALLVKRQPRHSEQDIVEQQFKILDESTLELKPVKKEWFDSN